MVEKVARAGIVGAHRHCGQVVRLHDAYLSIVESLNHAGYEHASQVELDWVDSESWSRPTWQTSALGRPGHPHPRRLWRPGASWAKIWPSVRPGPNVPYFGICLGMQIAVIEFARNVCGMADAHPEFDGNSAHLVIDLMPEEQRNITEKGGTMRLGAYPARF